MRLRKTQPYQTRLRQVLRPIEWDKNINRIIYKIFSTGFYRGKKVLKINKAKCIACGECTQVCPVSPPVMATNETAFVKHPDSCIECGTCVECCPVDAIRLTKSNDQHIPEKRPSQRKNPWGAPPYPLPPWKIPYGETPPRIQRLSAWKIQPRLST